MFYVRKLRAVLFDFGCSIKYDRCLVKAIEQLEEWIKNSKNRPSLEIRQAVYQYGIMSHHKPTWDIVFQLFLKEKDELEQIKLLNALSYVQDEQILTE